MLEDGRGIADYAPKSEQGAIAGIKNQTDSVQRGGHASMRE
jgi:hypothetical protein